MNAEEKRFGAFYMVNDAQFDWPKTGEQLEGVYQRGVTDLIVHPRFGLEHYRDSEYKKHFGSILAQARHKQRRVWFTEMDWPSGRGGGEVTRNPDHRAKAAKPGRNGEIKVVESGFHPAYTFDKYTDVLSANATDAFIASTHQWYLDHFGQYFADGTIAGEFCDEPGMYQNLFEVVDRGSVAYTPELSDLYEKMHGVPLTADFQHMWGGQDWIDRTARLRYDETRTELYNTNFLGRLRDWNHAHGLGYIGHVLEEENPLHLIMSQGDPFRAWSNFDLAGMDLIGAFEPGRHALTIKSAQAVVALTGKPGIMAETFGGFGWGVSTDTIDAVQAWEVENGVTFQVLHALFSSLDGDRRYDAPPSFLESPYFDHLGEVAHQFMEGARGKTHDEAVAVYYPVKAIQATRNPSRQGEARRISKALQDVTSELVSFKNRHGFDVDFDILNDGRIRRGDLRGRQKIILPRASVLPVDVLAEIAKFSVDGGEIEFFDGMPRFATNEQDQQVFEDLMAAILEGKVKQVEGQKPTRFSLEAALMAPKAEGFKYLLWHDIFTIKPKLGSIMSAIVGKTEQGIRWLDRRLVGIDRAINIIKKVKNYFFK